MGWFSSERRKWQRANPIAAIARARAGKPMTIRQVVEKRYGSGQGRAQSYLQKAWAENRRLRDEIKRLRGLLRAERKASKAQRPMADSGVNVGTYRTYQQGLREIAALTWKQQRLIYTMPEIRAVCERLLGMSEGAVTKKYAPRKYRKRTTS